MTVDGTGLALWVNWVIALVVGFGAALIGARATMRATKETLRTAVETEVKANRRVRWEEAAERRRTRWELTKGELESNLRLLQSLHVHHAWMLLEAGSLSALLGSLPDEEPQRLEALAEAHRSIRVYNAAAAYSNEKVKYGSGAMDADLETKSTNLGRVLANALEAVEYALHEGDS